MRDEYRKLVSEAKKAMKRARCPYSRFRVGAAVLASSGNIYTGVNVENASYGLTNCAERTALFAAVSKGEKSFRAVAVVSGGKGQCAPCGACRQVISEFGDDIDVIFRKENGTYEVKTIAELLPFAFRKGQK